MSYLYGDASPSPLTSDFIELLRRSFDLGAELLRAEARLCDGRARRAEGEAALSATLERLAALEHAVAQAAVADESDAAGSRAASAIRAAALGIVRDTAAAETAGLAAEVARLESDAQAARQSCARSLEEVLLHHELFETGSELRLFREGEGYAARLAVTTSIGLDADLGLEIPAAHPFAHLVRVDKLVDRLEVQAPEEGGWVQKKVKLRPQRLDREYVQEVALAGSDLRLKLRAAEDGSGAGFDVVVRPETPRVRVVRVGESELPPYELAEADAAKVLVLHERLIEALRELKARRRVLVEARLDGTPVERWTEPKLLVARLVEALRPIVLEIAHRSLASSELALKRLLGDGRREEIFVAKSDLRARLAGLPPELAALFDPLELWPAGSALAMPPPPPIPFPSTPPPLPAAASSRSASDSKELVIEASSESSAVLEVTPSSVLQEG